MVLERLGTYQGTWSAGLHFKLPFVDRIVRRMTLKEQVVDFDPQPVITKDNVTMRIDTVVFFSITDPKLYTYGVENPIMAIENLTATTLRNIIGDLELDQTLTSRETINASMRASLDVATDPWGIKVNRVELKNIIPPAAIQDAMEKQMKAERERREAIPAGRGREEVHHPGGGGQERVRHPGRGGGQAGGHPPRGGGEGEADQGGRGTGGSHLEGAAGQRRGPADAQGGGSRRGGSDPEGLEAFGKAADGKATKIIIPSQIQGIAGLAKSLAEVAAEDAGE